MPRALLLLSLLGPVLFCAPRATAQVEGSAPFSTAGTSAEAVDRFLVDLREALARDDRAAVAGKFAYPLQAWDGERSVKIKSGKQLLKSFDRILDPTLRATIAGAVSATAFANWQGVMFDDGRIWLRPAGEDGETLRIVTVNPPVRPDSAPPPAGSGAGVH